MRLQVPTAVLYPARYAAANYSRGNPLRKASIGFLKACKGSRPKLPTNIPEIRPLDMPGITFLPTDSMVMEAAYWFGIRGYEGIMSEVWPRLCAKAHSILEIGANVGLFTVIGAKQSLGKYMAVEPVPEIAAVLRENLRRNDLDSVDVLECAVIPSQERRDVTINIPDENHTAPVGAHLVEHVEVSNRGSLRSICVTGIPVTELINGKDLIKIDAEGIEAQLLAKSWTVLLRDRPTLVIEVLPEAEKLAALLKDLARAASYNIAIIPAWGSDTVIEVTPDKFNASVPKRFNSKDVVLTAV